MARSVEAVAQMVESHIKECDRYKAERENRDRDDRTYRESRDNRLFGYLETIDNKVDDACTFIAEKKLMLEEDHTKVINLWEKKNWQAGAVWMAGSLGAGIATITAWVIGLLHK